MNTVICEDEGAEELVLGGEFDIAIPFSVSYDGKELSIRVFPSQRSAADEFVSRFCGGKIAEAGESLSAETIFSPEALRWAKERFAPFFAENYFIPCDESDDYFLNYRIDSPDRGLILPSTRRMDEPGGLENLTGYDFDALSKYGHIALASVVDGKIVSAACTNYPCTLVDEDSDEREIEIGVETAEDYRHMGYGVSNAAALALALHDHGYSVLYECESRNEASNRLVAKLGGEKYAQNFCVVGRKD